MSEQLPYFRYHPDPVATGAVIESDVTCVCCQKTRGYIYVAGVYAIDDLSGLICPWCIASGDAWEKFEATFADMDFQAVVSDEIHNEVVARTPGYESWQGAQWLSHCDDACAFHGDASSAEVKNMSETTKMDFMNRNDLDLETCNEIFEHYEPGGNPALYKFVCLHCHLVLYGWDCT